MSKQNRQGALLPKAALQHWLLEHITANWERVMLSQSSHLRRFSVPQNSGHTTQGPTLQLLQLVPVVGEERLMA